MKQLSISLRIAASAAVLLLFGSTAALRADFTYQETTRITGGMMMGAMRIAGAFSKQAREPIQSTYMVKGNRLLHSAGEVTTITDLDKETITTIHHKERTYSVITFAQMMEMAKRAMEDLKGQKDADLNFKIDVKETGQKKTVQGFNTEQKIMTVEFEGSDQKSGQKGGMTVVTDMWLTSDIAGYDEVRRFHERMGQKLGRAGFGQGNPMMMGGRPEMAQAMAKAAEEASKIKGVPVLEVIQMSPKLDPETAAKMREAQAQQQQQQQQAQQQPSQQQPRPTVGEAAAGAIAGRLGRLGGFGRKKTQDQPPPPPEPQPAPQQSTPPPSAPPAAGNSTPPGVLMEMTKELTSFSSAAVEAGKFDIPAGYKQVESDLEKSRRGR